MFSYLYLIGLNRSFMSTDIVFLYLSRASSLHKSRLNSFSFLFDNCCFLWYCLITFSLYEFNSWYHDTETKHGAWTISKIDYNWNYRLVVSVFLPKWREYHIRISKWGLEISWGNEIGNLFYMLDKLESSLGNAYKQPCIHLIIFTYVSINDESYML